MKTKSIFSFLPLCCDSTTTKNVPGWMKGGFSLYLYIVKSTLLEGVLWNADYWYSRAGRRRPDIPLEEEWKLLVEEMLVAL